MPVPQAHQFSLEECIFQNVPDIFYFGKELMVIYTLLEQYFQTKDERLTDMMIDERADVS